MKRNSNEREKCDAKLLIKVANDGKWEVKKNDEEHTHPLVCPLNVFRFRSRNKLSSSSIFLFKYWN